MSLSRLSCHPRATQRATLALLTTLRKLLPGQHVEVARNRTLAFVAAVQIDQRCPAARVAHPVHQFTQACPSRGRQDVARVAKVVNIKAAPLRGAAGAPAAGLCVGDARPARARRSRYAPADQTRSPGKKGRCCTGPSSRSRLSRSRLPRLSRPAGVASPAQTRHPLARDPAAARRRGQSEGSIATEFCCAPVHVQAYPAALRCEARRTPRADRSFLQGEQDRHYVTGPCSNSTRVGI
jgi:hypothetical protein